ncbi:type 4b pilus protein PilO2 [Burkholderia cenocepacia]|uniref:type 4b pilus protein PilO2 n=1 Tax=Burkholderia cenocepacia TaxID=95486 RepID=UPI002AB64DC2|nr:type 4b pilus protein PilO2 [Burkholderia cenocepacia]
MLEVVSLPESRKPFVVGLIWRYEERQPSGRTLRRLAASDGAWGVVRKSVQGVVQVGQGQPIEGRKAGAFRSLAATIADAHPQPWVGRFRLEDGREWLIAVHEEHGILPDGDLIGSVEEIDLAIGRFGAESEWTQVSGTIDDLADLVRGARATAPLRDFTASAWRRWAVPVLGVATLAAAGGVALYLHARQVDLEEQARSAQDKVREMKLAAKAQAARLALPWNGEAGADAVIGECGKAWNAQDFARLGWVVSSWTCMTSAAHVTTSVSWRRAGGLASDAPGILDADGEGSVEVLDAAILQPTKGGTASDFSGASRAMWTFAQRNGLKLTFKPAETPKLPGTASADGAASPWSMTAVKLESVAPPWMIGAEYEVVPGLRVRETSFDRQSMMWSVEGVLYTSTAAAITQKAGL